MVMVIAVIMFMLVVMVSAHFAFVPVMTHEIDRHAAGVITRAVAGPVPAVLIGDPHVDRLYGRCGNDTRGRWRRLNDDGLRHDQLRLRESADVDATVHPRLTERDAH